MTYGTFQTKTANLKATVSYSEAITMKAEHEIGSMKLVELKVGKNDYVKAGDIIATVSMETDPLDLEEIQLKLSRLQERYEIAQIEFDVSQQERITEFSVYEKLRRIQEIEYDQAILDFEQIKRNYEDQITLYQEEIEKYKKWSYMTQIVSTVDGFILESSDLKIGQEIKAGAILARIIPSKQIYLDMQDPFSHYGYGMNMTLIVGDARNAKEYPVTAMSGSGKILSSNWDRGITSFSGAYDVTMLIGQGPFTLTGYTNVMDNVLLVPASAVTIEKQKYFVTVVNDDNTISKKQFIAGGNNTEYYWVYEGLEPGMKILLP